MKVFNSHEGVVSCCAFSRSEKFIVSSSWDTTLKVHILCHTTWKYHVNNVNNFWLGLSFVTVHEIYFMYLVWHFQH